MKIDLFRKFEEKINSLREELEKQRPKQEWILVYYSPSWRPEALVRKFYLKEEAQEYIDYLIGPTDPKKWEYYIAKIEK